MSLHLSDIVLRPSVGSKGRKIKIRANFFDITAIGVNYIYHYDVTIDPPDAPVAMIRKVWKAFEDVQGQGILKNLKVVFDGRRNVFSPKPLPLGETHAASFDVELPEGRNSKKCKVRIKKAGEINMEELRLFVEGRSPCTSNCLTAMMALDVLLRHVPSTTHVSLGRSFYTPLNKKPLPNAAEVWQGYYQSVRPCSGKMMINIDVAASAFYEPCLLPDFAAKILNRRSIDEFRRGISERDLTKLKRLLKGIRIKTVHRGERNIERPIKNLTQTSAQDTKFQRDDGTEISVAEYFLQTYNKRLEFPFLPCISVGKAVLLPLEVCQVLPGQHITKKLNEKQTADMIKFTCQKPHVRANKIKEGFNLLKYRENDYMHQFGVAVSPEMAVVNARVLPAPKVSYHASSQSTGSDPQVGSWHLRGKKLAQSATLGSWSVVNFGGGIPLPAIQRYVRELCQAFIDVGLNVVNRQPPILSSDPNGNVERTLKEAWLMAGKAAKANPQLILCIVPNQDTALYAEIKRVSDTVIGIPTQCIRAKNVAEPKKNVCMNVSLKVNLKLGGMNSYLDPVHIPFIAQRPTIVIGADVSHPGPGDHQNPSIAAMSASMDARASRYAACIRIQPSRVEIISDLANMTIEVLRNFYRACGQKPERILFYRDGVSDGQFKQVMESEVAAIRAACVALDPTYKPTLTFIVSQKRHHARFFPMNPQDADRSGNCLAGTVVDTDIVHPFEFDFYLQSHAGLQGTSRPTHYCVLYDDHGFNPDDLQLLTYNLCYTYGRATCAVSLVPPAYYADLIATRARYHRRRDTWSELTSNTVGSEDPDAQVAAYEPVVQDLKQVMYFI